MRNLLFCFVSLTITRYRTAFLSLSLPRYVSVYIYATLVNQNIIFIPLLFLFFSKHLKGESLLDG